MSWSDLDELLVELRLRHWMLHFFGPRGDLRAIGAVYQWETCADILILRTEDDASAFRVPTFPDTDVFEPAMVSWQYHASAMWTLRAVLTLEAPGTPGAPLGVLRPAKCCTVPVAERMPVTIHPT